ncbi:MAG: nicotinate-nucleotide--dimethylbenzimidazole phosphoribosyltransferase [Nitrosomonas sp.]|nr:nicotinate-nucleotide--dimethylbenzimidazole phosphoribosyltransferase [Nitrosomonas sp.]
MNDTVSSEWLKQPIAPLNLDCEKAARDRQTQLTKPPGSLGRLEEMAIRLAAMQGTLSPYIERVHIAIFAGDHGVAAEGVSAFPQSVTSEMIKNFANGGAAISVLANAINAPLDLINMGTVHDTDSIEDVTNHHIGSGTANFTFEPAMTEAQLAQSLSAGCDAVDCAQFADAQLFIGGEMGIGNSTSATALACLLLNASPSHLTGAGTGLDSQGIAHKTSVIQRALDLHKPAATSPLEVLRRVGGFEIAALAGAYIRCAQVGLPAVVDGFIATVAALAAERIKPGIMDWHLFSHRSTEPGHHAVLNELNVTPYLDLGLHLGEGSGAATLVPLLQLACSLHNEMATFTEATVSTSI